jgi:hypothetical protein
VYSRKNVTGRLLALTVAMVCSAAALPANAAQAVEGAGYGKALPLGSPEIDTVAIIGLPESPLVFTVSVNNGVPWISDPRSVPHWHNLRRVPGSQGGSVTTISVAQDDPRNYLPEPLTTTALRVTVKTTRGGIFSSVCSLGNLMNDSIAFPAAGPLPCTTWALIS